MSQLREHLNFSLINWFRWWKCKKRLKYLGASVFIDHNVKFQRFSQNISVDDLVIVKEGARVCACNRDAIISIGKRSTIGFHTFIFSSERITIGSDCLIAPFVYLVDSNHNTRRAEKINLQGNSTSPIKIEDDVWLASNVTVLKGVTIGKGAIIAANSLVNSNVPEYEIWGGSPAVKIGERE